MAASQGPLRVDGAEAPSAVTFDATVVLTDTPAATIGVTYGNTFKLHSLPGSTYKIYLDFDGHTTTGTNWNSYWGTNSFYSPAFTMDGSESFSSTELTRIQLIWQQVSEFFAPFNIDVTTEDPGLSGLTYSGAGDSTHGIRVVITSETGKNYGGIAYNGSFNYGVDTPAFVYATNLGNDVHNTAVATAHEIGHTLGLDHDGQGSNGYYWGHGSGATSWAPVMGVGYSTNVVQWSKGEYSGATNTQDDLSIITTSNNGVTYRADDAGNTIAAATALGGTLGSNGVVTVSRYGIITGSGTRNDIDMYSFTVAAGGSVNLAVSAYAASYVTGSSTPIYSQLAQSMLDVKLTLYNASGTVVSIFDDTTRQDGVMAVSGLAGGTYYLAIDGTGWGDPNAATPSGWTEYGSLGQYMVAGTYTQTITGPDVTPPNPPAITAVTDDAAPITGNVAANGTTNDSTPTLSGTAEANSTITLRDGGTVLGTTTANASGAWSFTTAALAAGAHSFSATATDAAGNVSTASAAFALTVDTTAPATPAITAVTDDAAPITGNVASGGRSNDATPTLSGTAEANSTVTILNGGAVLGTVATNASGAWSVTTGSLVDSTYSFTVTATDAAGNASAASAAFVLTVDRSAPGTPAITAVTDDAAPITGNVASGGRSNDTTPTLSGTAEANSTVTILNGGAVLGTVAANASGAWSFTPGSLADGTYSFTVTATDAAGNASTASAAFALTIDTAAPATPTISAVTDDAAPITGNVAANGSTNDATLALSGTAESNSTVTLRDGGTVLGTTVANASGAWSFTTAALAQGGHSFTATATDVAGNASGASAAFTLSVDTTAPATPAITAIADDAAPTTGNVTANGTTDDTTPTLSGTAESNSTVTLRDGGTVLGTTVANASGAWSFTTAALAQGGHSFTATATDAAGNASGASAAFALTIDTTAPATPAITAVTDDAAPITGNVAANGSTNDATLALSGTAEANSTVTLRDGGTVLGTTIANDSGAWSFTTAALADGAHSFSATARDSVGNLSAASAAFALTIDTTAPATPAITAVTDDAAPITGNVAVNGSTNDTTPTLSGTAEANSTVTILNGPAVVGTAVANASGTWSFTTAALADGSYSFTATAMDATGNLSAASAGFGLTINTAAAPAPTITGVTDDVAPRTGAVTDGGVTNDATPTLAGTAQAGSTITILDGGAVLGTATADASGAWTFTTTTLVDGAHSFTATATNLTGGASAPSAAYLVTVDTVVPTRPVVLAATDDQGATQGIVAKTGVTDDAALLLNGTAEAGTTLTVRDSGVAIGTVTADAAGTWSFATAPLADGTHSFTVRATDAAGNLSLWSFAYALTVDTTAPGLPVITTITDDAGAHTGSVAPGGNTDDITPSLSGTAEAGSTVAIHDAGVLLGTTTADATGLWSYTTGVLADGGHSFTATATDSAGNTSGSSAGYALVVATAAAPRISTVTDDLAPRIGTVANGGTTNDTAPNLAGTAQAGSTVIILDSEAVLGTALANASGAWSFTTTALIDGIHSFTALATTAAGVSSRPSTTYLVTVDTVVPTRPVVLAATDDQGATQGIVAKTGVTDDTALLLNGTAEAGSSITVRDNGVVIGTTAADAAGAWSFSTATLAEGAHSFTVRATDAAGNFSVWSLAYALTVDTTAPGLPVITAITDDAAPSTGTVAPGGSSNDTTPTLSGTAEANSSVTIRDGATLLGTATADAAGLWSFTTGVLAAGGHDFTVTATDAAGNTSGASASYGLLISTAPPPAPAITGAVDDLGPIIGALANGAATNDTTPTLSGTAMAGSSVQILDAGVLLGTTAANAGGAWTFTTAALAEGGHSFTARVMDATGMLSAASAAFALMLDSTAPGAPAITLVFDDVAPTTGAVAAGGITNDKTPTLAGTAEAGSTVSILAGETLLGTTIASAEGSWAFTAPVLADGPVTFVARAADAAGNVSTSSAGIAISIDSTAPDAPIITGPTGIPEGSQAIGAMALGGQAEAGSTVTLYDNGAALGTTVADGGGSWVFVTSGLASGSYRVTARATDAAGNTSAMSAAYLPPMALTLDKTALTTSEGGGTDSLVVRLLNVADPLTTLSVSVTGLDATEGSLSATTLVLNAANNWTTTLGVTGVDDRGIDGAQAYTLTVAATGFAAQAVQVTNLDNDLAASSVTAPAGTGSIDATDYLAVDGVASLLREVRVNNNYTFDQRWSYTGLSAGSYVVQVEATATEAMRLAYSLDGGGSWTGLNGNQASTTWSGDYTVTGVTGSLLVALQDVKAGNDRVQDSVAVDLMTIAPVAAAGIVAPDLHLLG